MAVYRIKDTTLQGIADAIRLKKETAEAILAEDMAEEIKGIETGISLNGVVEQYRVNAGATVSAGDFVEFILKTQADAFSANTTTRITAKLISTNVAAVLYYENSKHNIAVLSFEGESATLETVYTLPSAAFSAMDVYGENEVFVAYAVNGDGIYSTLLYFDGSALVERIAPTQYANAYTFYALTCDKLADGKVVLFYTDNGATTATETTTYNKRVLRNIATVTESEITHTGSVLSDGAYSKGTNATSSTQNSTLIHAQKIGDNKVAMTYYKKVYSSNSYTGSSTALYTYVYIIQRVDGMISVKTNTVSQSETVNAILCPIGEEAMAFITNSNVTLLSVSGLTATSLADVTISTTLSQTTKTQACRLSPDTIAICSGGTFRVYRYADETLSLLYSVAAPFEGSNSALCVMPCTETSGIIWREGSVGAFISYEITAEGIVFQENTNTQNGTYVQTATSRLHNVGVAKTSGTAGETVEVVCVGS